MDSPVKESEAIRHRVPSAGRNGTPELEQDRAPGQVPDAAVLHAVASPQALSPQAALALQRLAGNRAVSGLIQARLVVGPAGDRYEQEADRVAEQVLAMPAGRSQAAAEGQAGLQRQEEEEIQTRPLAASITPLVQRQEDEEEIQTKSLLQRQEDGSFEAGSEIESRLAGQKGGGDPLPGDVRAFMEPRFGADFSDVRVHTGSEAVQMSQDLQAQAFTHGRDVYLGAGRYDPGSDAGKRLLAHELTHVVQQTGKETPEQE